MSAECLGHGSVCIDCVDRTLLDPHSNESIYAAYDIISGATVEERPLLQQCLGLTMNPDGLLRDHYIRTFYKPRDHTLRDWMHMLVNSGVANTECAQLINALSDRGISIQTISAYMMTFVLPRRHDRVEESWVSKKRMGKKRESLQSFSGILLSIVQLLVAFLLDTFTRPCEFDAHIECFVTLWQLLGVCSLGPVDAVPHVDLLRKLIEKHGALFVTLYGQHVKPKFHHLLHVTENVEFLGRLLSCFVTERKHRQTKRTAVWHFRHIDNSVLTDLVSELYDGFAGDAGTLLDRQYLVDPKAFQLGDHTFYHSKHAALECGMVSAGDLVYTTTGAVCKVINFWSGSVDSYENMSVRVEAYTPSHSGPERWTTTTPTSATFDVACIMDAVMWAPCAVGEVRVIPPFKAQLADVRP